MIMNLGSECKLLLLNIRPFSHLQYPYIFTLILEMHIQSHTFTLRDNLVEPVCMFLDTGSTMNLGYC